jgi:hypothetical protein
MVDTGESDAWYPCIPPEKKMLAISSHFLRFCFDEARNKKLEISPT